MFLSRLARSFSRAEAVLPALCWPKTVAWVRAQPSSKPNRNQREIIVRIRFLLEWDSEASIEFTRISIRMQDRDCRFRKAVNGKLEGGEKSPLIDAMRRPRRVQLRASWPAFQSDVAAITQIVQLLQDARVVDFPCPRLVAARMIGHLIIGHVREVVAQMAAQIPFRDLQVIQIGKHLYAA